MGLVKSTMTTLTLTLVHTRQVASYAQPSDIGVTLKSVPLYQEEFTTGQ